MASTFDHKHYVPILGGKAGEYRALRDLTAARRAGLTPLIEVPPVPWDFENDRAATTIDTHLSGTAKNIADHWGDSDEIFVDMYTVADEGSLATGKHPLTHVFDDARGRGLKLIPVTGLERDADYNTAVRNAAATDKRGAMVRLTITDISDGTGLGGAVDALLAAIDLTREQSQLLVDFGPLLPAHETTYLLAARNAVAAIPALNDWRTFTLAGAAFPVDTTVFTRDAVTLGPRTEWRVWTSLAAGRHALRRMPAFGDYAVDSPGHDQLDFRFIKMNAHIRYCHTNDWVVVKGHLIKKGQPTQYPGLAQVLRARPEYSGPGFSAGDRYVDECAGGLCGPGNATTWRQVAVNHHLSFVVDQIAILPGL